MAHNGRSTDDYACGLCANSEKQTFPKDICINLLCCSRFKATCRQLLISFRQLNFFVNSLEIHFAFFVNVIGDAWGRNDKFRV